MEKTNERSTVELPTTVLGLLITAALGGGAGIYGFVGPQIERSSVLHCTNLSAKAVDMANRNAEDISGLRQQLYSLTADRYTSADAARDFRKQAEINERFDRRLTADERLLDKLEKRQ